MRVLMIALNKILLVYIRYLKFDVFVQILKLKIVFATSERERKREGSEQQSYLIGTYTFENFNNIGNTQGQIFVPIHSVIKKLIKKVHNFVSTYLILIAFKITIPKQNKHTKFFHMDFIPILLQNFL